MSELVVVHRSLAAEGEEEPEHAESQACPCRPFAFDPTDIRFATQAQIDAAIGAWEGVA
jgi:hypothetical protein